MKKLAKNLNEIYKVTDKEIKLYSLIKENSNTEKGYYYYFKLTESIIDNNLPKDILYDAASCFRWDDKLDKAFKRFAIENGREDLI